MGETAARKDLADKRQEVIFLFLSKPYRSREANVEEPLAVRVRQRRVAEPQRASAARGLLRRPGPRPGPAALLLGVGCRRGSGAPPPRRRERRTFRPLRQNRRAFLIGAVFVPFLLVAVFVAGLFLAERLQLFQLIQQVFFALALLTVVALVAVAVAATPFFGSRGDNVFGRGPRREQRGEENYVALFALDLVDGLDEEHFVARVPQERVPHKAVERRRRPTASCRACCCRRCRPGGSRRAAACAAFGLADFGVGLAERHEAQLVARRVHKRVQQRPLRPVQRNHAERQRRQRLGSAAAAPAAAAVGAAQVAHHVAKDRFGLGQIDVPLLPKKHSISFKI